MPKNVHIVHYNSQQDQQSDFALYSTLPSFNDDLRQLIEQQVPADRMVVLVNEQAVLPPHWLTRLCQPLLDNPEVNQVSALSLQHPELSPIRHPFAGDLPSLDQAIYLLQDPGFFSIQVTNPHGMAWRHKAAMASPGWSVAVNNLVLDVPPAKGPLSPPEAIDVGDQHPLPAHPLAAVQAALANWAVDHGAAGYPGLDPTNTVLHVVMDWGGGVHRWTNDFINNHPEFNHWVLISAGEFFRQRQGERCLLYWGHTDGLLVQEFHFSDPIAATATEHPEYAQMMRHLVSRYSVDLVVVSSLIGHAMDCLRTGLPTWRVLHDYFPHWPSLNAQLDQAKVTEDDLQLAMDRSADEPFGRIDRDTLDHWQQAHNDCLAASNVTVIAPDVSVKTNHLKLPHASSFAKTQIIPHAATELPAIRYQATAKPFKILVLGRISQPKGEALLRQCVDQLADALHWQFILLGAGKHGKLMADLPNTQVIEQYDMADLGRLVNELSPQLALLTSITAETFSYTLSELLSLGVPVLATAVGAFVSRIEDDHNGWLVPAEATAMVDKIQTLSTQPDALERVHQQALQTTLPTTDTVVLAYQNLLKDLAPKSPEYHSIGLLDPAAKTALWGQSRLDVAQQKQRIGSLEQDLSTKISWAEQLDEHNQHLTENLALERTQNDHLTQVTTEQTEAIQQLEQAVNAFKGEINGLQQELQEARTHNQHLDQQIDQLHAANSTIQGQLQETLNSRSWRYTAPLRRFTTYARHKRNAVKFRFKQLRSLPRRVINSLKTRGLKQTAQLAKNKLKKPPAAVPVTAHNLPQDFQPFSVPRAEQPVVSVVIPVYNHFQHTNHCLQSLSRLADETPFEVIVVDDCSSDETATACPQIDGIRYHRQAENGGFIEACNTGAAMAAGQYVLFLNNDTEVLDGWLDNLVKTFAAQPQAGLVGSQLLYPDGRLQEAGGIVFSDASGWNYGRLDSPDAPEYQHLREVSYISGASIMISRDLFEQLGRFDQRYKPAYYEDTDLAFAVRQAGLKVYYQPLSRVIHFEGISSGTDLNSGTKKYQVINQQKFLDKWATALSQQPQPGTDIELARFQQQPPRVLILDACTPTPDQDSGSLRMMNLMQIYSELGHHVSFMPENMAFFDAYTQDLQRLGVACIYAPKYGSAVDYLQAKGRYYDLVILSRYYVAEPVMPMIRSYCPKAQIWFDTVDLHYLREGRMAEMAGDAAAVKAAATTKQKEYAVAQACDLTLVVSPYEKQVMHEENPDIEVAVLSNIHAIHGGHVGYEQSRDIMFIGGYQHTPNVDGILWFVEDILPTICQSIPALKLHIIGSKAPPEVVQLGDHPNVEFHGFVADIEPLMRGIRLAVAPLRFGAGVKGKVNMSMSYGQPVVGTHVAVEGMYTQHRHDVMMADDAAAFAAAVTELYQSQTLWEQLSKGGLENVEKWFSFAAAKNTIADLMPNKGGV
ncbi:glycosyltransferase [Marinicella meishanensis]|uniref:glycosyltransferase n=1 Tax=Marinicella meishanensis TaxID=2873263 RepID=UPI001CBC1D55|nr:glycosyltransferase [Marinicella sp. NBU2979]